MARGFGSSVAVPLAFFAAAASAQSGVQISGNLDIGVYRDLTSKWNVGSIQRSNIAFSGTEDLGNGYAAIFKLSHRFDLDTGMSEGTPNKPFWHGESTVGFKSPFGTLRFGRALDAIWNNDYEFDPWYNFNRLASPAWDLWHYNFPSDPQGNNGTAEYGRLNNGIFYDSPSMAGFSLHLSASPEKRTGDLNRPLGVSLNYKQGPYAAMLASAKNSAGNEDTFVGLKGTFSNLSVMGGYDVSKAAASKAKGLTIGLQYPIGAFTLNAGWGKLDVDSVKVQEMISFGTVYSHSKRTSLYADVADKRFPGSSKVVFGAGVAHSF
jgi:predicted porin